MNKPQPLTPEQKQQAIINANGTALLSIINTVSVECANKAGRITELEIENAELRNEIAELREAAQEKDNTPD